MRSCDPTVRALALDGVHRARDRGREADAVLGVPHVVVHRLRDRDHLRAEVVEPRRVGERVVAADGEQVLDPEAGEVREDGLRDVPRGRAVLRLLRGEALALEVLRQRLHLGRVRPRRVEDGAAGAVDGARVLAAERQEVPRAARRLLEVQVGEALPAEPDPDHLDAVLGAPVGDALDDRVEARDVSAAGEDADALDRHAGMLTGSRRAGAKTERGAAGRPRGGREDRRRSC